MGLEPLKLDIFCDDSISMVRNFWWGQEQQENKMALLS